MLLALLLLWRASGSSAGAGAGAVGAGADGAAADASIVAAARYKMRCSLTLPGEQYQPPTCPMDLAIAQTSRGSLCDHLFMGNGENIKIRGWPGFPSIFGIVCFFLEMAPFHGNGGVPLFSQPQ